MERHPVRFANPALTDGAAGSGSDNTLLIGGLAVAAGLLIFRSRSTSQPLNMARRKSARRKPRATAAKRRAPARRKSLTGVRRRARGRVRAAKMDVVGTISTVAEISVGGLGAMVAIAALAKITNAANEPYIADYNLRAALVAAAGVGVAMAVPGMKNVGIGLAVGAAMGAGAKAIASTEVGAGLLNGMRRLSDREYKAILQKVKAGGVNGQPMTLSNAVPVLTGYQGESAVMG